MAQDKYYIKAYILRCFFLIINRKTTFSEADLPKFRLTIRNSTQDQETLFFRFYHLKLNPNKPNTITAKTTFEVWLQYTLNIVSRPHQILLREPFFRYVYKSNQCLHELLSCYVHRLENLRPRGHDLMLPACTSNLHKQSFIIRSLFDFI